LSERSLTGARRKADESPRNKIDQQKIRASLNTTSTLCGFAISPADVERTDFEHIRSPNCGKDFVPGQKKA